VRESFNFNENKLNMIKEIDELKNNLKDFAMENDFLKKLVE